MCYMCAERNKLRRVFLTAIDLVKALFLCSHAAARPSARDDRVSCKQTLRNHLLLRPNFLLTPILQNHGPTPWPSTFNFFSYIY